MRHVTLIGAALVFAAACSNEPPATTPPPAVPTIAVDLKELNFGEVSAGTRTRRTVHVRSAGTAPLVISSAAITNDGRQAFANSPAATTLQPGEGLDVEVTYAAPSSSGDDRANLVFSSNDAANPSLAVALLARSVLDCGFGEIDCNGSCTNVTKSTDNCGECGRKCDPGLFCVNGKCVTTECTPKTCLELGKSCGAWPDGCGGQVQCASCPSTAPVCDATGACKCVPKSCADLGKACGSWSDGCGAMVTCAGCTAGTQVCDVAGQCCTKKTCADLGKQCGTYSDGCGGTLVCAGCTPGAQICDQATGQCCTKKTCADYPNSCGPVSDGCGGSLFCNCGPNQLCQGASGACCTKKTCTDYPGGCGTLSDGCGGSLFCSCAAGLVCDTTAKTCCAKKTCAADYPNGCGALSDGCGGSLYCTCASASTQTCVAASNTCCTKKTCADYPGGCGTFSDGCGGNVFCGCATGEICLSASSTCCRRKTCAADYPGKCGEQQDGCGGTITCGCAAGQACMTDQSCCTKKTCTDYPNGCGALSDGCGGTLTTCACPYGTTCLAASNSCCKRKTCTDYPGACGSFSDGCGATVSCLCAPNTQTCLANQTCCTKKTCADYPGQCGALSDGCGGTLSCGCSGGKVCDAASQCVCATSCAQLGKNCGYADLGCGLSIDCGACSGTQVCGGGGVANVCACKATSCAEAGRNCGALADGCGTTLNCGSCPSGQTCSPRGVCGAAQNLVIFANNQGGTFTIDVDQNLPGLVIAVLVNRQVNVTLTGAYLANVVGVHVVVGQDSSTSTVSGVPASLVRFESAPLATLQDPRGNKAMVCESSGGATYPAYYGCNTREQVQDYFLKRNGGVIAAHACQSGDFTGTVKVSAPGTCACVPYTTATCTSSGFTCGTISDGCGGTVTCGTSCPAPYTCGGGGKPNVCGGCGVGKPFIGPRFPTVVVDDATIPGRTWSSLNLALASDDQRAYNVLSSSGPLSTYLKVTGFGFTVPANATVNGILVQLERRALSAYGISDNHAYLVKNDAISTLVDKAVAGVWSGSDAVVNYGSATDLWGDAWTPADINSAGFGFALATKFVSTAGNDHPEVDSISTTVCFTAP